MVFFLFFFLFLKPAEAGGDSSLLFTPCVSGAPPASLLAAAGSGTACLGLPPLPWLWLKSLEGGEKNPQINKSLWESFSAHCSSEGLCLSGGAAASLAFVVPTGDWILHPPALPVLGLEIPC